MKLSTLLEMIGSGSVLLVVGVGVFAVGLGYGFTEATGLPLWASFCGLGLFAAIVGYGLVDRGSDQAEEQVKAMSPMFGALRNPWLIVGAAVFGGIILQRLLRGRREVVVETVLIPHQSEERTSHAKTTAASPPEPPKKAGFSISQLIGDQLRSLGTVASEAAVAMALQSLKLPSVQEIIDDLLAPKEQQKKTDTDRSTPDEQPEPVEREYAQSTRGSNAFSHNGFNHPGEFDPTV